MRALFFSRVLVKFLMMVVVYGTRLIDEEAERGSGERINKSPKQPVNFGFEEKTLQTDASWIVPIMEVLRDKGVIQTLFDEGGSQFQSMTESPVGRQPQTHKALSRSYQGRCRCGSKFFTAYLHSQ